MSIPDDYLSDVSRRFHDLKTQADRAIAQLPDPALFEPLGPESNSIAVLMRHMGGNLRSRWRDFLTTDGEKPDRDRDGEFAAPPDRTRAAVTADWESGWACLFDELARLGGDDLARIVTTRHEPMTALSAINRQLLHAAQHVGQIILLARHAVPDTWQTLTIARGQSAAFNESMKRRFGR